MITTGKPSHCALLGRGIDTILATILIYAGMMPDSSPPLIGPTLYLRPLLPDDFEALYQAAADPLVWAQHPSKFRYQRPVFQEWFEDALTSAGALVVIDRKTDKIIGSSRYYGWDDAKKEIAIGFTFLARAYWGGITNAELKQLMLAHAFHRHRTRTVWFHIAPQNIRSRKAMEKIGGQLSHQGIMQLTGEAQQYCFYKIESEDFLLARTRLKPIGSNFS